MSDYFDKLDKLQMDALKEKAALENVPIIKDETLKLILFLVKFKSLTKVLEIGTAVGYTSMMLAKNGCFVETIEINEKMYNEAISNITKEKLNDRIRVIKGDALEIPLELLSKNYDIIFIDAAKAQYRKFFERFSPFLNDGGVIVIDNLLFHGFVDEFSKTGDVSGSRNLRGLARKIDVFNHWLCDNKDFETTFLDIGDGVALCVEK